MSEPIESPIEGLKVALEPTAEAWYQKRLAINPEMKDDKEWEEKEKAFHTEFWVEKFEMKDSPMVARIDGKHYIIGEEDSKGMRGFDGRQFTIKFFDGTVIVTTNLWHQGEIPSEAEPWLPNNAEFTK
jgi:hypothetical protein